ncbi:MAG TPA: peptidoglycan-binding domain-containing protein [Candidatus Saccharimonadales bacterium]|nr:peptidoglycan-binding domain-containing protein [Candidatus Saccharimonadales bacterium]
MVGVIGGIVMLRGSHATGTACRSSATVVRRGSTGHCVSDVQALLDGIALTNYFAIPSNHGGVARVSDGRYFLNVDGDFGGGTDAGVRAFQTKAGIGIDGIVGQQTWRSLCYVSALKGLSYSNALPSIAVNGGRTYGYVYKDGCGAL